MWVMRCLPREMEAHSCVLYRNASSLEGSMCIQTTFGTTRPGLIRFTLITLALTKT